MKAKPLPEFTSIGGRELRRRGSCPVSTRAVSAQLLAQLADRERFIYRGRILKVLGRSGPRVHAASRVAGSAAPRWS